MIQGSLSRPLNRTEAANAYQRSSALLLAGLSPARTVPRRVVLAPPNAGTTHGSSQYAPTGYEPAPDLPEETHADLMWAEEEAARSVAEVPTSLLDCVDLAVEPSFMVDGTDAEVTPALSDATSSCSSADPLTASQLRLSSTSRLLDDAAAARAAEPWVSPNTRVSIKYQPFMDAWDRGHSFNAEEVPEGQLLQVAEGAVPPELHGTYLRVGPGRFARGDQPYRHPHDGDGLVAALALGGGRVHFRSAFVRTHEYQAEEAAGRVLFRSRTGTQRRGGLLANAGDLTVKAAANAGVTAHGGRLLAHSQGGLPYALEPRTLATLGPDTLGGALAPGVPLALRLGDTVLGPALLDPLTQLHRRAGSNAALPPAFSAPGGVACAARPAVCGHTGRLVSLGYKALVRVDPEAMLLPQCQATQTALTFWEEAGPDGDSEPLAQAVGAHALAAVGAGAQTRGAAVPLATHGSGPLSGSASAAAHMPLGGAGGGGGGRSGDGGAAPGSSPAADAVNSGVQDVRGRNGTEATSPTAAAWPSAPAPQPPLGGGVPVVPEPMAALLGAAGAAVPPGPPELPAGPLRTWEEEEEHLEALHAQAAAAAAAAAAEAAAAAPAAVPPQQQPAAAPAVVASPLGGRVSVSPAAGPTPAAVAAPSAAAAQPVRRYLQPLKARTGQGAAPQQQQQPAGQVPAPQAAAAPPQPPKLQLRRRVPGQVLPAAQPAQTLPPPPPAAQQQSQDPQVGHEEDQAVDQQQARAAQAQAPAATVPAPEQEAVAAWPVPGGLLDAAAAPVQAGEHAAAPALHHDPHPVQPLPHQEAPLQPQLQAQAAPQPDAASAPPQQSQALQPAPRARLGPRERVSRKLVLPGNPAWLAQGLGEVALTENYYLLLQPPIRQEGLPHALGDVCIGSSLRWRGAAEPSVLRVVPRPGSQAERRGEQPLALPLSPASVLLRVANAYEDPAAPHTLHLDGVHADSLPALGAQPLPEQAARVPDGDAGLKLRLRRLVVDLAARTVSAPQPPAQPAAASATSSSACAWPAGRPCPDWHLDQPAINPAHAGRRHRYVYAVSALFDDAAQGLVKLDMESRQAQRWSDGPGYFCSGPTFVPRTSATPAPHAPAPSGGLHGAPGQRGEDDGWLLALGFDSGVGTSELLIFDAWALPAGPVARVALPGPLPHGLHAAWSEERLGPEA